jgi:hypothetical protein
VSCDRCGGLGILPNKMDAPNGPECACGKPSRWESGWCGTKHPTCLCDCERGKRVAEFLARRPPAPTAVN